MTEYLDQDFLDHFHQSQTQLATLEPDQSSDNAARAFQLEGASGVPASIIGSDPKEFDDQYQTRLKQQLVQNNPYLADFIRSNPLHAQLIRDDIPELDELTQHAEHLGTRQSAADREAQWITEQKSKHLGLTDVPDALMSGIYKFAQSFRRTAAVATGSREKEAAAPTPYEQPFELGDLTNIGSGLAKVTYRLAESSPSLGVGLGVTAMTENPIVGIAAGALSVGGVNMIQALGDEFQKEIAKNPYDPDGAYNRALESAASSGAFSAAGWALFPAKFVSGPLKNMMFQIFGVQPAIGAAHRGFEQARTGEPQNYLGGYIEDAVGGLLPAAVFGAKAGAFALRRGGPIRPYGEGSMEIIPPEGPAPSGPIAGRLERPATEGLVTEEGPTDMSRRTFLRGTTALAARTVLPQGFPSIEAAQNWRDLLSSVHPVALDIAEEYMTDFRGNIVPSWFRHDEAGNLIEHVATKDNLVKYMTEMSDWYASKSPGEWEKTQGPYWSMMGLEQGDLIAAHRDAAKLVRAGFTALDAQARVLARIAKYKSPMDLAMENIQQRAQAGEFQQSNEIGAESQQAQENKKLLDEAVSSAEKPTIRQTAPQKLQELLDQLPSQSLRIRSEAIGKLYNKLVKEPNAFIQDMIKRFEALHGLPGNVYVGSNRYLANVPKDLHKELSDDVAVGDDWTPSETKELEELKAEPQEGIYGPAIRVGGKVYEGNVHEEAYDRAIEAGETAEPEEGYVSTLGRFVDPVEAFGLAQAQGQLRENPLSTQALLPDDLRPINFKHQAMRIGQEVENRLSLELGSRTAHIDGKIIANYYYRRSVETGISPEALFDEDNVDIRFGMEGSTAGSLKQGQFAEGKNMLTASLDKMMKSSFGGREWVQVPETGEEGQGLYWRYSPAIESRGGDLRHPSNITIANVNFQHKGTGAFTAYLDHIEDLAKQRGIGEIHLENIENERLIPFYQRKGYQKKTGVMEAMQVFPSMIKRLPQGRTFRQDKRPNIMDVLKASLRDLLGYKPDLSVIPGGENKQLEEFMQLFNYAAKYGLEGRQNDMFDDLVRYVQTEKDRLYQLLQQAILSTPTDISPFETKIGEHINQLTALIDQAQEAMRPTEPPTPPPLTAKERGERLGIRLLQQTPRGRIGINDYRAIIELFSKARVDTLLHEFFHLWGINVFRDALRPGANYKSIFMRTALLQFVGREPTVTDWQQLSPAEHERIADAGVMYVREGKAPATDLIPAFETYSKQLQGLYRDSSALGAPLTNAMREFFGKLLATNEQIKRVTEPTTLQLEMFRRTVHIGGQDIPDYPYQDGQHLQDLIDNPSTQWQDYVNSPLVKEFLQRRLEPKHTADSVEHALEDSFFSNRLYYIGNKDYMGQEVIRPLLERTAELAGGPQAIRQDYVFTVIVGPPGAGKSTVTEGLAQTLGARVIDTDDMREVIQEYQGGAGIFSTASEASALMIRVMNAATARGDNIIHSFVGSNPFTAVERIMERVGEGYKLNVVHVHVDANTAVRRVMKRFVRTGRIVEPDYVAKAAENTPTTYERVKSHASEAAAIDNSGPVPVIIDGADTELGAIIGRTARGVGDTSLQPARSSQATTAEAPEAQPAGGESQGLRTFEQPDRPFQQARAIGRTEKELRRYLDLIAKQDAEDVEFRRAMAQKLAERQNKQEWKARKAVLEPVVRKEIEDRAEVAAWQDINAGKFKIKADAVDITTKAQLPSKWFTEGGLQPDDLANYFGYTTGDEWLQVMVAMVTAAKGYSGNIVDRLTKHELHQRLLEELGPTHQQRLDEVMDHALNVTTMELLYEKTFQAGLAVGAQLPLSKAEMDWGIREGFHKDPYRNVSPQRYLREAQTAARNLEKAALDGNALKMFQWAQASYIALTKAKLAREVEREGKAFKRAIRNYGKAPVPGIDAAYLNWLHWIFIRLQIPIQRNESDVMREINAGSDATLNDFLGRKHAAGRTIPAPDFFIRPGANVPKMEEMEIGDARAVMQMVRSLIRNGRDEKQIIVRGDKMDLEDLADRMIAMLQLEPEVPALPEYGVHHLGRRIHAALLQMEVLFNRMGRGRAFSEFNLFMRPIMKAANEEAALDKSVANDYRNLPGKLTPRELNKAIPQSLFKDPVEAYDTLERNPNLRFNWARARYLPFTRLTVRRVMLDVGNQDNLNRLAKGYGLQPDQIMDWLFDLTNRGVIDKRDWDWAQAHGDMFEDLKRKSEAMERRISGIASERVPIFPIQTPVGVYPGWYNPILPHQGLYAREQVKDNFAGLFSSAYVRAGTPQGYTKSRTERVWPIDLDMNQIPGRLWQEIHDITYREAVIHTAKLFYHDRFKNQMRKSFGVEYSDLLEPYLKDVANTSIIDGEGNKAFTMWLDFLRQNAMATYVGFGIRTVEKHTITAALMSIDRVGGKDFLNAFFTTVVGGRVSGLNDTWQWSINKSQELQRRHRNWIENISGAVESELPIRRGPLPRKVESFRKSLLYAGSAPVAFFDLLSAVPTWYAAYMQIKQGRNTEYNRFIHNKYGPVVPPGMDEGDAIEFADAAVRAAHGSTAVTSRPGVMRQGPIGRMFTSFYSFFSRIMNREYELAWQARIMAGRGTDTEARHMLKKNRGRWLFGLFVTVVAVGIIDTLVTPYDKAEKDDPWLWAAKSIAEGQCGMVPYLRDACHALIDNQDPTMGLLGAQATSAARVLRDLKKDDFSMDVNHGGKLIKDFNILLGVTSGLSNTEFGNLGEFVYDLNFSNKNAPENLGDWYRGITKGETRQFEDRPDMFERMLRGLGEDEPYRGRRRR